MGKLSKFLSYALLGVILFACASARAAFLYEFTDVEMVNGQPGAVHLFASGSFLIPARNQGPLPSGLSADQLPSPLAVSFTVTDGLNVVASLNDPSRFLYTDGISAGLGGAYIVNIGPRVPLDAMWNQLYFTVMDDTVISATFSSRVFTVGYSSLNPQAVVQVTEIPAVPEPSTWALFLSGIVMLALWRRSIARRSAAV